jgi:hypothetical protein
MTSFPLREAHFKPPSRRRPTRYSAINDVISTQNFKHHADGGEAFFEYFECFVD